MSKKPMLQLDGIPELRDALGSLKAGARNRVNRSAMSGAARVGVKSVKAVTPRHYGFLRRAQSHKVKTYKNSGVTVAVIGTNKKAAYSGPGGGREVPANYDHLVHDGHINKDGSFTPGSPYLRIGIDIAVDDMAGEVESKTRQGIAREADKAARKARRR
ncbi:MAG: hypothetical protein AAGH88_11170 [Planctomycetota bacterium]